MVTPVSYADYFKGGFGTHLTAFWEELSGAWDVFTLSPRGARGSPFRMAWAKARRWWRHYGCVHLERTQDRPARNITPDCRHVWLFPGRARADHHGANVVAGYGSKFTFRERILESDDAALAKPIGSPVLESVRYAIESSRDVQTH